LNFTGDGVSVSDTPGVTIVDIPQGGHIIQDEGVDLPQQPRLNFTGDGVTVSDSTGETIVDIPQGGHIIQDEGVDLPQQPRLNFTGDGVTVSDSTGETIVDIPVGSDTLLLFGNILSHQIAAGTTIWFGPGSSADEVVEERMRMPVPAGTIRNFRIRLYVDQPATGTYDVTVLKNGVATSIFVSIPAGATPGQYIDTIHSFTTVDGDEISIQAHNNASSASGAIRGWSLELQRS